MKFISTQNRRTLITVFLVLAIISEMGAYVALTPPPTEQFFQFYVLGKNGLAADYYPLNSTDILLDSKISWYLGVTNFMGNVQLVEIRLKLGNETTTPPNDTTDTPASAPEFLAFDRALTDNETWEFPFVWSITNATATGGTTHILTLQINNQTYQISDWSALKGYNFRLILELWVWQGDTNTFEFGWGNSAERRTAWLQLWFNMTNIGPPP